jgi:hypothetical protein
MRCFHFFITFRRTLMWSTNKVRFRSAKLTVKKYVPPAIMGPLIPHTFEPTDCEHHTYLKGCFWASKTLL